MGNSTSKPRAGSRRAVQQSLDNIGNKLDDVLSRMLDENDYLTRGRPILHISILLGLVVICLCIQAQIYIYKHTIKTSNDQKDKDVYNTYNTCMYVAWSAVGVFGLYAIYNAGTYWAATR